MPDFRAVMLEVLEHHADADKWVESSFEKIRRLPNTKVGDAGQDFVEELCKIFELDVQFPEDAKGKRSKQSPWDIQIEGVKFELKTATEDVHGAFQFNHVRYARKYQALICLGIGPEQIYFNLWSKAEVTTGNAGTLVSMEKSGSASYKLTKRKDGLLLIEQFDPIIRKFLADFNS